MHRNSDKGMEERNLKLDCTDDEDGPLLGPKYWANFLKRQPQLTTKHCVRFDSQCEAWATFENFEQMYDDVYQGMVKSGIAIELEDEVWVNKEGTESRDRELYIDVNMLTTRAHTRL